MRQVIDVQYGQLLLLAPSVEEWIGPEHPARFIREVVEKMDLKAMKFDTLVREEGGVAYAPRLLLSAWLYGYFRKVRSTRALERACREEMGFIWLTGNHRPDHNSLWRFWSEHKQGVKEVFVTSVKVAIEMGLVGMVLQAVDGTKVMAACSGRGGYDQKQLTTLLEELEIEVKQAEEQIAQAGAHSSEKIPEQLHQKQQLRDRVKKALDQVQAGEKKHVHPLEPEATRMECDGRNRFAYNAQAVVDQKVQIILASEVTSQANDSQQLVGMVAQAQANSEPTTTHALVLADGGYANAAQAQAAQQCGYQVVMPPPNSWRDTSNPYHAAHFQHDAQRQVVICPQKRELPLQRIRIKEGKQVEVYRSAQVCKDCPVRSQCTKDRHGRSIDIQPGHAALVETHRRWNEPATAELYELRASTIEPVFAQIKQNHGFRRFTHRGLQKVKAQWAMLCATWNLRVAFSHWKKPGRGGQGLSARPHSPLSGPSGQRGRLSPLFTSAMPA